MVEQKKAITNLEELRQASIYLHSDEQDRDFDILLFIDPDEPGKRTGFIRELYQVLIENKDENSGSFAKEAHKRELKEWLGKHNDNQLLTPLNWLKIAIERYPNRLLIAIDPAQPREAGGWKNREGQTPLDEAFWCHEVSSKSFWSFRKEKNSGNSNNTEEPKKHWIHSRFLYNRLCWLNKQELFEVLGEYERLKNSQANAFREIRCQGNKPLSRGGYFRLWLYLKWVLHLSKRVRQLNQRHLLINFYNLYSTSEDEKKNPPYFADTLPPKLRASEPGVQREILMIDLEKGSLRLPEKTPEELYFPTILFRRHANTFRYYEQTGKWHPEYGGFHHVFYGESLSGALSYWTTLVESLANMAQARSLRFILSLVEQGLLRSYLVDERIQDWYDGLTIEMAGSLVQQRVFVAFLDSPGKFNQRKKPGHNLYAEVKVSEKEIESSFNDDEYLKLVTTPLPARNKLDLLVIHQGILDKWKPNGAGLLKTMLDWKDSVPFLVITSGRGVPTNLVPGVKFLPYSALEACINGSYFEKLTLIRQVNSLIRDGFK